jgi:hypothetical protein
MARIPLLHGVQDPFLTRLWTAVKPSSGFLSNPVKMSARVLVGVIPAKLRDLSAPALHAGLSLCREQNGPRSTKRLREPCKDRQVSVELYALKPRTRSLSSP